MNEKAPQILTDPEHAAETVVERVGPEIVLALPLGLGKANHLANALFARAAADPSISLTILTALTLQAPQPGSDLERRFLDPLADRFFSGYPALAYARAQREGSLPDNVVVREFYLQPGRWLGNPAAQQNYLSINYTHVLGFLLRSGFNVLGQLIAPHPGGNADRYSLSGNPDISVDLFRARERGEIDFLAVGQVNRNLPYMNGAAERGAEDFDLVLQGDAVQFPLFRLPHEPISLADHAIGLRVAALVPDGGTLQIGIGSIGDAIAHALLLRHRDNPLYARMLAALGSEHRVPGGGSGPFEVGLYGCSEMLVEGFLHLLEAGILRRDVDGAVLHAGFFLGSPLFYRMLGDLPAELREKIAMMPVSFTNTLYRGETARRAARTGARFVNSALMATLLGAVVSDGLEDGRVVSGVGGQYNFVAMAFALDDARSIITLPATRTHKGRTSSNIRWSYGHVTIPRHLRDIVVTEYGVADLRDKTDAEVIGEMLAVADSRFQQELLEQAQEAGKLPKGYRIPEDRRDNTPERLASALRPFRDDGHLAPFPLGSDFSAVEEKLAVALQELGTRAGSKRALAALAWSGWRRPGPADGARAAALERMGLDDPQSIREWVYRFLLQALLEDNRNTKGD